MFPSLLNELTLIPTLGLFVSVLSTKTVLSFAVTEVTFEATSSERCSILQVIFSCVSVVNPLPIVVRISEIASETSFSAF